MADLLLIMSLQKMITLPKLPDEAWNKIVDFSCDTLREILLPITASTGGIGRIIKARFDILEAGQINDALSLLLRVNEKLSGYEKSTKNSPKRKIILDAFDEGVKEEDVILKELWASLLAKEIAETNVHPEYLMILQRLSSKDAIVLSHVARSAGAPVRLEYLQNELIQIENEIGRLRVEIENKHRASSGKYIPSKLGRGGRYDKLNQQKMEIIEQIEYLKSVAELGDSFSHKHLKNIGLISSIQEVYGLTELGRVFVDAVGYPNT